MLIVFHLETKKILIFNLSNNYFYIKLTDLYKKYYSGIGNSKSL
jgi:hypothetical protein